MAEKKRGKSAEAHAKAPGLQRSREFVAPDGSIVAATQAEYKDSLRAQGYRPVDGVDTVDEDEVVEEEVTGEVAE